MPLRSHAKLEAMLKLEAGDLSKEANALGLLLALDRVELSRGLPKHLKVYAVGDSFNLLFGVERSGRADGRDEEARAGDMAAVPVAQTATAAGHPVRRQGEDAARDATRWRGPACSRDSTTS